MKERFMKFHFLRWPALLVVLLGGMTLKVSAFSLIGPFSSWQVPILGYRFGEDIGGPVNLGEGFRWNVPLITYACDSSFINYFGPEGVRAIDEAMQVFNDLPAPSKISADLSEYSVNTQAEKPELGVLGLFDLKSTAMNLVMEELGFADPIRYTFTLRARQIIGTPPVTNYATVQRNYDPQTLQPSRYVNGVLYSFSIREFPAPPFQHADAIEETFPSDLTAFLENIPVATGGSRTGSSGPNNYIFPGFYRTGLTRDDVGGIRYLYHPNNYAVDSLLPGTRRGGALAPFTPFLGTNVLGATNSIIGGSGTNLTVTGLRGGRNRLKFRKAFYDPILSAFFTTRENAFTDVVISTNRTLVVQPVTRVITRPDIVFSVGDLGLAQGIAILSSTRTDTTPWINNDLLNGVDPVNNDVGPGTITPQVQITFTSQFPNYFNSNGDDAFYEGGFPENFNTLSLGAWASFDGSANDPVIYPKARNISINQLRNIILNGGTLPP